MRWRIFRAIFSTIFKLTLALLGMAVLLTGSVMVARDQTDRVRTFTRHIEFDYLTWTLDAVGLKLGSWALAADEYISAEQQPEVVVQYLHLIWEMWIAQAEIEEIYADPNVKDPQSASAELDVHLEELQAERQWLQPLAEAAIEAQVSQAAADAGLSLGGQVVPPVLFHMTPPPSALIVSPRDAIQVDEDISISPDLSMAEIEALEEQVDQALDVSSLVVGIGGIGVYPTMVMETINLSWLVEVVAHEWVHNFLSLHPLGLNYLTSPELRIMNEMAASLAGMELGQMVMERYYQEYLPEGPSPFLRLIGPPAPQIAETFNYRAEMRETRVYTEQLLADGKIEEAEQYMEQRRVFLWDNGYHIRKINQAFFAFYGAYADPSGMPGAAAGEDPVAAAVYTLREQSETLGKFINRMAWMASYAALQRAILPEE